MSEKNGLGQIIRRAVEAVHIRSDRKSGLALCGAERIGVMGVFPEDAARASCPRCVSTHQANGILEACLLPEKADRVPSLSETLVKAKKRKR